MKSVKRTDPSHPRYPWFLWTRRESRRRRSLSIRYCLTETKDPKTPSYPPVRGRLDTFSACVSSSREVSVSGLPLQGDKRGSWGLLLFFLFIYFSLYIKKKINKNNNKWWGKSGKGGISYWCSIRIVIYTLWISGGDMCGKGNDKCGFLHMMENG